MIKTGLKVSSHSTAPSHIVTPSRPAYSALSGAVEGYGLGVAKDSPSTGRGGGVFGLPAATGTPLALLPPIGGGTAPVASVLLLALLPATLCDGLSRGGRKDAVAVSCRWRTNAVISGGGEVASEEETDEDGDGEVEFNAAFGNVIVTAYDSFSSVVSLALRAATTLS